MNEAFSTMDVYIKKRWDLIPNLVEIVKGYATHEKETLQKIVELRNTSYNQMSTSEKVDVNNQLSSGISKLMAFAENYPDLKANENFKELSEQLEKVEEDIANSRKYYNGSVKAFNNLVQMFPSNIIASMFGYTEQKIQNTLKSIEKLDMNQISFQDAFFKLRELNEILKKCNEYK